MSIRNRRLQPCFSVFIFLALLSAGTALGQETGEVGEVAGARDLSLFDYHNGADFLPQSPSVTGGAVGALANPASWATGDRAEIAFWWNDRSLKGGALDNWGLSLGRTLGFALDSWTYPLETGTGRATDFQIGLAGGGRRGTVGLAYRWSDATTHAYQGEKALLLGFISRPSRHYSLGLAGTFSTESDAKLWVADLGLRPLGSDRLTLFGDYSLREGENLEEGLWGAGVELRPIPGLHLGIKFREANLRDDKEYRMTLNLGVTLGGDGLHFLPGYDEDGDHAKSTFLFRQSPSFQGLPIDTTPFSRKSRYVAVNLENKRLTYQKYRWWDKKRVAWLDLVRYLDAIAADENIDGVALNLAGLSIRSALAWELRAKLKELQAAGKEIIIHGDDLQMHTYYLASVADHLSLDPLGQVLLPGLSLRRTYLKGTLEKLGLGFQEWRYFTHKSALEAFSRSDMSEADRQQLGRMVDVIFEEVRDGICEGRGLNHADFEALVENDVFFVSQLAKERRLVDRIARWADMEEWLASAREGAKLVGRPNERYLRDYREEIWGELPTVAVIYAVGECAMDKGIKGRALSEHLRSLAKRRDVAAVVFRADSPGGEGLPSDLVAEGIQKIKEAGKPVIVSQGSLAASGGYWISMNGTKILTTPITLTGSIGVAGGWIWDDGLGEKLGLTADGIQRGSHSDLFSGLGLPFLGERIPLRPLTEEELALVKDLMLGLYDEFVVKVAAGRDLDEARVRELGEGRVWMGVDAVNNGLCDGYGSLGDAIALAKEMAGLNPQDKVRFQEFPPRPLFALPGFGSDRPTLGLDGDHSGSDLSGLGLDRVGLGTDLPGSGSNRLNLIGRLSNWARSFASTVPLIFAPTSAHTGALLQGGAELDALRTRGLDPSTYEIRFLQAMARAGGAPLLMVPPDAIPAAWREGE